MRFATDWLSQLGNPYSRNAALDREGRVAIDQGRWMGRRRPSSTLPAWCA